MDCSQRDFRQAFIEGRVHEVLMPACDQEEDLTKQITEAEEPGRAEIQVSPGVLNQPEQAAPLSYETTGRSIGDLPVRGLIHFTLTRDYVLKSVADRPIIAQTDQGDFCLERWDLVEEAISLGHDLISCEVDVIANHSDLDLMIRKAAMRTATRGGEYLYPEIIRNTRDIYNVLTSSNLDLRIFCHGGSRQGEEFENNPEKDALHVISLRLGLNRDTVSSHLLYAKYLSDDVLDFFVQVKAKKRFFENAQNEKRKRERLEEEKEGSSIEEITRNISAFMREFHEATGGEGRRTDRGRGITPNTTETISVTVPEIANNRSIGIEEDEVMDNEDATAIWERVEDIEADMGTEDEQDVSSSEDEDFITDENITANEIQDEAEDDPLLVSEIKEAALEITRKLAIDLSNASDLEDLDSCLSREGSNLLNLSDRARAIMRQNW